MLKRQNKTQIWWHTFCQEAKTALQAEKLSYESSKWKETSTLQPQQLAGEHRPLPPTIGGKGQSLHRTQMIPINLKIPMGNTRILTQVSMRRYDSQTHALSGSMVPYEKKARTRTRFSVSVSPPPTRTNAQWEK